MHKLLHERREQLQQLLKGFQRKNYPKGVLQINQRNQKVYYYVRKEGEKAWAYLKRSQEETARKLAQRDYEKEVIRRAKEELSYIDQCVKKETKIKAEDVYDRLPSGRKRLVTPIVFSDEMIIANWQNQTYERKDFPEGYPEFYTRKGERVRSKSEALIADELERRGLAYHYEKPLWIEGRRFHPDFTVLHPKTKKEFFWEHLGMMDSQEYVANALSRFAKMEDAGYLIGDPIIVTWETSMHPLDSGRIAKTIDRFFA